MIVVVACQLNVHTRKVFRSSFNVLTNDEKVVIFLLDTSPPHPHSVSVSTQLHAHKQQTLSSSPRNSWFVYINSTCLCACGLLWLLCCGIYYASSEPSYNRSYLSRLCFLLSLSFSFVLSIFFSVCSMRITSFAKNMYRELYTWELL